MKHTETLELKREIRILKKSGVSEQTAINILKSYGFNEEIINKYWEKA